ncbi:MAG TPA: class I SAM-dependent methyltransferase [Balneolales bacterium]|nr:class I SAM-dependent methyltransferase [Balneolales bacterium]
MERKRTPIPIDVTFFQKEHEQGHNYSVRETFLKIYNSNHWNSEKSASGPGSDDVQTAEIQQVLPGLNNLLSVKTFLDLPCGDCNWMSHVDLGVDRYIGGDIIPDIITKNQSKFEDDTHHFQVLDIINDPLPDADLLLCRDCLVHLSNADIKKALDNIRVNNITYLLTTTFTDCKENADIITGDWRIINLERPPFSLPAPMLIINEHCTEGNGTYSDKSLGLWKLK